MPTLFSDFLDSCLAFMQRALAVGIQMKRINVINKWIRELRYDDRADKYERIDRYLQSEQQQVNSAHERIDYNKIICNILAIIINGAVEGEELASGDAPLPDNQLFERPEPQKIHSITPIPSEDPSSSHTNNTRVRSQLRWPMTSRRCGNTPKYEMMTPVSNIVEYSREATPSEFRSKIKQPTSYVRKTGNKPPRSTPVCVNSGGGGLQMNGSPKKLFTDLGAACLLDIEKHGRENEPQKISITPLSEDTSSSHTNNTRVRSQLRRPMTSRRWRNTSKCEMMTPISNRVESSSEATPSEFRSKLKQPTSYVRKTGNKPTRSTSTRVNTGDGSGMFYLTIGPTNKLSRAVEATPNIKNSRGRKREENARNKRAEALTDAQVESLLIRRHHIAPGDDIIKCDACNDVIDYKVAMLVCGHQMDRKCVESRVKYSAECFLCRRVV